MIKEISKNTATWKDICAHALEELNYLNILLKKITYTLEEILIKIPMAFLIEMEKNPEVHMK